MSGAIVEGAGYSRASLGINGFAPDVPFHYSIQWGGTNIFPDSGVHVNMTSAMQKAQMNAMAYNEANSHDPIVPLAPPIDDAMIRKAIFELGEGPGAHEQDAKDYALEVAPLRKAILDENAEYIELVKAETAGVAPFQQHADTMMHVQVDQDMTLLYKRGYPIQALIPAAPNFGKYAVWDVIPPFGFGSASFGEEDQGFTETDIEPKVRMDKIRYMYAVGRVTKAAQIAGMTQRPARDIMSVRVNAAQDAVRALRERSILGVTRDVSKITGLTFQPATSLQYPGMHELITKNTDEPNYVTATDDAPIATYDDIMKAMDDSFNLMAQDGVKPNLAICDLKTFSIIRRGLANFFRIEPVKKFVQGVSKISLVFPNEEGLPLVPTEFLPMTPGATGSIMMIDTKLWERRVLWQDTMELLAKINLSQKFVVSAAETLIDRSDKGDNNEPAHSLMGGVFGITRT
jgi:hypothetical protein